MVMQQLDENCKLYTMHPATFLARLLGDGSWSDKMVCEEIDSHSFKRVKLRDAYLNFCGNQFIFIAARRHHCHCH